MYCPYFEQSHCHSCKTINTPYSQQLSSKQQYIQSLLNLDSQQLLPAVESPEKAFRNKAKMVVMGVAQAPVIGIESPSDKTEVSLEHCPLYSEKMQALLSAMPGWIQRSGLPPYNRHKCKGELKYILVHESAASGKFMLRFVLRSTHVIPRIENNLQHLYSQFPDLSVISVNIQPVHMARLEGDEEIYLTENTVLEEELNQIPLMVRPKSFFQTNPHIAEKLYATVTNWVKEKPIDRLWDLFCGVGGFALHCAPHVKSVVGIEIEPEAIQSAKLSADRLGLQNITFSALDSTAFSESSNDRPDAIIVNPPRRGLGKELVSTINAIRPKHLIYSSCNPETLAQDLMSLQYDIVRVQLFDMFPHTEHIEVLVELKLRP